MTFVMHTILGGTGTYFLQEFMCVCWDYAHKLVHSSQFIVWCLEEITSLNARSTFTYMTRIAVNVT